MEDSIERQHRIARELWEQRERRDREYALLIGDEEFNRMEEGTLLRRCREELGLDMETVTEGPLLGIITTRRLRRVEHGAEDVPPKAWHAYARLLHQAGRKDIIAEIAAFYPEVNAS